MECQGFARSNVAGEFSPRIYGAVLAQDVSNSTTSFVNLLTCVARVETPGEVLSIFAHASVSPSGSSTPHIQVTVDGVVVGGSRQTSSGSGQVTVQRNVNVSNLAPGNHVVKLDFKTTTAGVTVRCRPVTQPTTESAQVIVKSSILQSHFEKGGFPLLGWSPHYGCGVAYTAFSGSATDSSASPATALLTLATTSHHAQSALLCKFTACGTQLSTGANVVKFKLLVDGNPVCGTSGQACETGVASVRWNGVMFALVPVQAGNHTLEIDWSGGSGGTGSSITTSDGFSHAELSVEEVFAVDCVNSALVSLGRENICSDMGGFATSNFSAKNVPTVTWITQDVDITGGVSPSDWLSRNVYVRGDDSALEFNFSGAVAQTSGAITPLFQLMVDGNIIAGTETINVQAAGSVSIPTVLKLPQGNHLIEVQWRGGVSFTPVSNPDFSHANLIIREVPNIGW